VAGRYTIQRVPRGLLDLLGLKGFGDNPTELEDKVRGVVDLTQLYLGDQFVSLATGTPNISANGFNVAADQVLTVPAGTYWLVSGFVCQRSVALAAATSCSVQLGVSRLGAVSAMPLAPDERVVLTGETFSLGVCFNPGQLVLRPGDRLGCYTQKGLYGTPFPISMQADVYALEW
jgi:hypothetical protein